MPSKRDAFIGPEDLKIIDNEDKYRDYLKALKVLQEILERLSEQPIV
ncbi:MAG: hypothetical protein P8Y70_01230 [Candidatus Lokiarchaeota archaeon]